MKGSSSGEIIFKVLGWGTAIHLLVIGYSLDKSALFELQAPKEKGFLQVDEAKKKHTEQLEIEADSIPNSDKSPEAAELRVQAAEMRAAVHRDQEEQNDGWFRAVGLMVGVFIYCLIYPVLVWLVYKRTETGGGAAEKDVVPLGAALTYGISISLATFYIAVATACR
jgi:hypothetical protein